MTAPTRPILYTPQILALAVELGSYPYDADAPIKGAARSRTCGGTLSISFADRRSRPGLQVTACAIGQAAAAIFARHFPRGGLESLKPSADRIANWLADEAPLPDWPDLDLIASAREYPARHGAILLPWNAAIDALCKDEAGR